MTKTTRDLLDDLRSDDKKIARNAARVLGSSGDNTLELLLEVLKDGSVSVDLIAEALKPKGGAARAAIIPLLKDAEADIQERAVRVLGALGDVKVVDPLLDVLKTSGDNVRIAAVEALGTWGAVHKHPATVAVAAPSKADTDTVAHNRVIGVLEQTLAKDVRAVRAKAANALGEFLPDERALVALLTAVKGTEPLVRAAAIQGLAKSPADAAIAPRLLSALQTATSDPDINVRQLAAAALQQQQGDKNAMRRLAANQSDYAQHAAAVVEQMLEDKTLDDADREMLWNSNPYIRGNVLDELGKTADDGAIPLILPALRDINPAVRKNAVDVLVRFGEMGIKRLLSSANDSSMYVRAGIAEALGRIGNDEGLETLITLAGDKEVMVRKAAVQALGAFQSQLANQALRRAAKDSDTAIRELAETLLQDRGENASQNPIARFFRKLTGGS